ncbi:hypothetical protein H0H93_007896, partial [Arthromyces matolae]
KTLSTIYTPEFRVLLEGVTARSIPAHAYRLLEKTKPVNGLWDLAKFDDVYYTLMKAEFESMIAAMKVEADYEAEALFFNAKRKASTELEEGKASKKKKEKDPINGLWDNLFDCELYYAFMAKPFEPRWYD